VQKPPKLLMCKGYVADAVEALLCRRRKPTKRLTGFFVNVHLAVALHFMYYNFGRIHQSLRITPAMVAGVSNRVGSWRKLRV